MKKPSEVFSKIRFAKGEQRGKPHPSTDDEEHGAVGEVEWNQQLDHQKKRAMQEEEQLDEKNAPTNPSLWSRAKALARSKFDVYPSAYANGWASKWYKSKGGGWKTVSEEKDMKSARIIKDLYKKKGVTDHDKYKEEYKKARAAGSSSANARARASGAVYEETLDEGMMKRMATDREEDSRVVPFDKPYTTVKKVVTDKSGAKHGPMSRARDLARKGTRAAAIVREAADKAKAKKKEKKESDDTYQADPELSSQIIRND